MMGRASLRFPFVMAAITRNAAVVAYPRTAAPSARSFPALNGGACRAPGQPALSPAEIVSAIGHQYLTRDSGEALRLVGLMQNLDGQWDVLFCQMDEQESDFPEVTLHVPLSRLHGYWTDRIAAPWPFAGV